jgi:fatty-acyl-CoA synthase
MMKMPLLVGSLIDHAERYHGETEIVSVETTGGIARRNWLQTARQARKLASALTQMGLARSDRVATLAWNNYRHLEIYFGASGGGFVCHTINPRLFADQLVYVINHAQDKVLFVDKTFLPIVAAIRDQLPNLKTVILLGPVDGDTLLSGLLSYDAFIETGGADYRWPELDEDDASSLCYTSGTTGHPKGVLYSHRSTLLHSFAVSLPDSLNISARGSLLPAVPMFHVNAWGIPYAAAMNGARLVLPGPGLDGASLVGLIEREKVTCALGVPTIWQGLLAAASKSGAKLASLETTVIGGSACHPSMIDTFQSYGVEAIHAWGMTELSPVGSVNQRLGKHAAWSPDECRALRSSQGRPPFGIELAIQAEDHADGQGNLVARGHWVIDSYFGAEAGSALKAGWFDTGDIATLDADGFLTIRDRSKDIIKSGGEWISSVELEGIAMSHPGLADAAVIGVAHEKWGERPMLIAVKAADAEPSEEALLRWFSGKVASWQVPDKVVFTEALPRNATGKVRKTILRETWGNILTNGGRTDG